MNRHLIIILSLLALPLAAVRMDAASADSLYNAGKYEQAASAYEAMLKQGESADIYYNLGNAYYRLNDLGRAILNYERALRLRPGDGDIRFNLSLARSKTIDRIAGSEGFIITYWIHSVINLTGADGWAVWATVLLALLLAAIVLILLLHQPVVVRLLRCAVPMLVVGVIVCHVFAGIQRRNMLSRSAAIVMHETVVRSTPSISGNRLFTLHPGARVEITDATLSDWHEITLADGKKGWIATDAMEAI